jgi:glutathione synthase/RimK-type ligase-like ATP-grasp enzyme
MTTYLIVADDVRHCSFRLPGAALISARDYLTLPEWREACGIRVLNLCQSCGYQRVGYYVSLLAEARGHRPLPDVNALKDHGRMNPAMLTVALAQRCTEKRRSCSPRTGPLNLAILRDPGTHCPASNEAAIAKFEEAARSLGVRTQRIGREDGGRLSHFDGMFIRDNTFIQHYTYRFSRRAAAAGLAVIDDPDSILRCNNKVYLAELLPRHGLPVPRTLIVHRGNLGEVVPTLGLPCVLKRPDSSLSMGVARIESQRQLLDIAESMLRESDLIVAQEYLPTPFDWRIGVLDGEPLFACKYHMVPGHWQILRHADGTHYEEGPTEALRIEEAPAAAVELARRAARLIGDGFYGIDLKEAIPNDFRIIEVNDNPNVDAGNEDGMLRDALYLRVMSVLARRMAARRRRP